MADKISRYDVSLALKAYSTTMSLTKLQQTEDALKAALKREAELEAKLEKAVEAIELARNGLNGLVDSNDAFDALNATLAELKGDTDE